jgi:hypothetical protein
VAGGDAADGTGMGIFDSDAEGSLVLSHSGNYLGGWTVDCIRIWGRDGQGVGVATQGSGSPLRLASC